MPNGGAVTRARRGSSSTGHATDQDQSRHTTGAEAECGGHHRERAQHVGANHSAAGPRVWRTDGMAGVTLAAQRETRVSSGDDLRKLLMKANVEGERRSHSGGGADAVQLATSEIVLAGHGGPGIRLARSASARGTPPGPREEGVGLKDSPLGRAGGYGVGAVVHRSPVAASATTSTSSLDSVESPVSLFEGAGGGRRASCAREQRRWARSGSSDDHSVVIHGATAAGNPAEHPLAEQQGEHEAAMSCSGWAWFEANVMSRLGPSFVDNPELEAQFEAYWCRILPIIACLTVWRAVMSSAGSSRHIRHTLMLEYEAGRGAVAPPEGLFWLWATSENFLLFAIQLAPVVMGLLMCLHPRTRMVLERWPRTYIFVSLGAFYVCEIFEGIFTQMRLPHTVGCVQESYCEAPITDLGFISMHFGTICYLNLLCPILQKFKALLNVLAFLATACAFAPFYTNTGLFALICCGLTQWLTMRVGRLSEKLYRQSILLGANLRKGRSRMSNILSTMLPQRLLAKPITVPMVEKFENVTVLFCSFEKNSDSSAFANSYVSALFVKQLSEIYMEFDDAVWQAGMYKVEHVGEDYVVCSPEVDGADAGRSAEYAAKLAELAVRLVGIGNTHEGRAKQKGLCGFKFKAGLHHGEVVAGIVGRSRRFYRLFGDTVVTAARLCQSAPVGKAQISEELDEAMGDKGPKRGEWYTVPLKNKAPRRVRCIETPSPTPLGLIREGGAEVHVCEAPNQDSLTEEDFFDEGGDKNFLRLSLFSLFDILSDEMPAGTAVLPEAFKGTDASAAEMFVSYADDTLDAKRWEARAYLMLSRAVFLVLFSCLHFTGSNEGWDVPGNSRDGKQEGGGRLPLFLGPTWAGIAIISALLARVLSGNVGKEVVGVVLVAHNVIFGSACVVAAACTSNHFSTFLLAPFIAQMACSGLDYRLAFLISLPFIITMFTLGFVRDLLTSVSICAVWHTFIIVGIQGAALMFMRLRHCHEKNVWRKSRQVLSEHRMLSKVLTDLLPGQWAERLIEDDTGADAQDLVLIRNAVVLFSDMTGFTALTEKLGSERLVGLMHKLWCCFDSLTQKWGVYKMDTVGDAYVVIGLVGDHGTAEDICETMVMLAREMVLVLQDFSHETGETLGIRIGIDYGEVVTGVIGTLQPRFHAFGEVMASAQRLEGACEGGSVLVSDTISAIIGQERWNDIMSGTAAPVDSTECDTATNVSSRENASSRDGSILSALRWGSSNGRSSVMAGLAGSANRETPVPVTSMRTRLLASGVVPKNLTFSASSISGPAPEITCALPTAVQREASRWRSPAQVTASSPSTGSHASFDRRSRRFSGPPVPCLSEALARSNEPDSSFFVRPSSSPTTKTQSRGGDDVRIVHFTGPPWPAVSRDLAEASPSDDPPEALSLYPFRCAETVKFFSTYTNELSSSRSNLRASPDGSEWDSSGDQRALDSIAGRHSDSSHRFERCHSDSERCRSDTGSRPAGRHSDSSHRFERCHSDFERCRSDTGSRPARCHSDIGPKRCHPDTGSGPARCVSDTGPGPQCPIDYDRESLSESGGKKLGIFRSMSSVLQTLRRASSLHRSDPSLDFEAGHKTPFEEGEYNEIPLAPDSRALIPIRLSDLDPAAYRDRSVSHQAGMSYDDLAFNVMIAAAENSGKISRGFDKPKSSTIDFVSPASIAVDVDGEISRTRSRERSHPHASSFDMNSSRWKSSEPSSPPTRIRACGPTFSTKSSDQFTSSAKDLLDRVRSSGGKSGVAQHERLAGVAIRSKATGSNPPPPARRRSEESTRPLSREPSFRRPSGSPARWDRSSPEPASLTQQFTGLARAMSLSYSPSSPRGLPLEFSASPILGDLPRRRGGSSRESSGTFLRGVGGSPRGTPISGVARSPVRSASSGSPSNSPIARLRREMSQQGFSSPYCSSNLSDGISVGRASRQRRGTFNLAEQGYSADATPGRFYGAGDGPEASAAAEADQEIPQLDLGESSECYSKVAATRSRTCSFDLTHAVGGVMSDVGGETSPIDAYSRATNIPHVIVQQQEGGTTTTTSHDSSLGLLNRVSSSQTAVSGASTADRSSWYNKGGEGHSSSEKDLEAVVRRGRGGVDV